MTTQATILKLADEIVTLLKAGEFDRPLDVRREYITELEIEHAADEVRVDVIPDTETAELDARLTQEREPIVQVVVRYRFEPEYMTQEGRVDRKHIDKLVLLFEEIQDHLTHPDNRRIGEYAWVGTEVQIVWSMEHLRRWNQYTGAFRITYSRGDIEYD